ncbi:MAG: hypothetical protein PHO41_05475, partial [Eubacteriales bacterium]|nr:hypothetical protein [Eubacteriales bacterium]
MRTRLCACLLAVLCLFACTSCNTQAIQPVPLPPPMADPNSMFGVDKAINMETIDQYLGREDVAYRDVRMLFDPAAYED